MVQLKTIFFIKLITLIESIYPNYEAKNKLQKIS